MCLAVMTHYGRPQYDLVRFILELESKVFDYVMTLSLNGSARALRVVSLRRSHCPNGRFSFEDASRK